ncbi:hypothetical protein [Robiginitalea aurantiaca]|uniref:Uncharacterized protein n=1 Tax=Robiginitalea aurantiaca TaxID=3056915 RepID=A0ABT7WIX6_9FLAO|nr:hypothetical protein [Robiginitalea aurantiaca]MDM9632828.1 hypothetical protein [Robiginitalea aurantiaca]
MEQNYFSPFLTILFLSRPESGMQFPYVFLAARHVSGPLQTNTYSYFKHPTT